MPGDDGGDRLVVGVQQHARLGHARDAEARHPALRRASQRPADGGDRVQQLGREQPVRRAPRPAGWPPATASMLRPRSWRPAEGQRHAVGAEHDGLAARRAHVETDQELDVVSRSHRVDGLGCDSCVSLRFVGESSRELSMAIAGPTRQIVEAARGSGGGGVRLQRHHPRARRGDRRRSRAAARPVILQISENAVKFHHGTAVPDRRRGGGGGRRSRACPWRCTSTMSRTWTCCTRPQRRDSARPCSTRRSCRSPRTCGPPSWRPNGRTRTGCGWKQSSARSAGRTARTRPASGPTRRRRRAMSARPGSTASRLPWAARTP